MNESLKSRLERALGQAPRGPGKARTVVDDRAGQSLRSAAKELFLRAVRIARQESPGAPLDRESLETACLALHLPFTLAETTRQTSMGVLSMNERCSQATELMIGAADEATGESLERITDAIERTTRILSECPRRGSTLNEARVLADAINLEDFGISGICRSAAMILRPGGAIAPLADAYHKREQYGYWEARLKDGFHFPSSRELARQRLKVARESIRLLMGELEHDSA